MSQYVLDLEMFCFAVQDPVIHLTFVPVFQIPLDWINQLDHCIKLIGPEELLIKGTLVFALKRRI